MNMGKAYLLAAGARRDDGSEYSILLQQPQQRQSHQASASRPLRI
jgi:hypothetical protein